MSSTLLNMQAVIYTRISKDRAGGELGVDRQREDCQKLADELGWTVVETFSDNDISAFSGKSRPAYEAMLAALEAGKAQAVIAWHTDRLHRRPIELEGFIELCERKKIEVRAVRAGHLDFSTPAGRTNARVLGAMARYEIEHLIERAKSAKKQAALEGKFRGGRRAFGYESDGLRLRELEAEAIRTATQRVLSGVSLRQIARDWNAAGLRTAFGGKEFTSREVRTILLRPRNAGIVLHEGQHVGTGRWDAIIDAETFAAIEALLCDPARSNHISRIRKYQGSGVYLCGKCGARMGSASQVGSRRKADWRKVYTCSKVKHLGRVAEYVDEYVSEHVIARLNCPDARQVILGAEADLTALHAQREGLRARLDELTALFADSSIDGLQLKRGTSELHAKLAVVDAELASVRSSSAVAAILAEEDVRAAWKAAPPEVRGKVIDTLMTVTILPAPPGRQPNGSYFDPTKIQIEWKTAQEAN
ncbi:recombinase [Mycobacteroides abscessus subsp. massiliense]|nr:recombinase [Mycobacteroides abscessus subsp. massiliense]SKH82642.1 recombinase [Mycobacteroides abscessus subsp. massiliense]SKI05239.1 recombinase [Mycobacteroides abscessus subsp. massiliense]SKI51412.1 recombinase [Mycobacteroides abscessus subsp. massiliense]SKJ72801.1 recombinase [Mycobacteroides abscessus subsp. massiliense]